MNRERSADIAIVGAGIVGLAHAYMALRKGYKVVLFERDQLAVGASVRNFGLLWPVGQEPGKGLDRALRGREHWLEIADQAGFWINQNGSLHVAYHDDEWAVLNEFDELCRPCGYQHEILNAGKVKDRSAYVNPVNLKGGLWSKTECTVNPREAIRIIPEWLHQKYGLTLCFGHVVKSIELPTVKTSYGDWKVDKVIICNGADFESLYPEIFNNSDITKCKLQMMKAVPEKKDFILGPTLCGGLTLRHYAAFSKCPSLSVLNDRYNEETIAYKDHGIHVMVAQHSGGELIIGDSHHYGRTVEPFVDEEVNNIILRYLRTFTSMGNLKIIERWHGIYPKMLGALDLVTEPEKGVTIVNCLGGAGMTLSFGLAEDVLTGIE